MGHALFVVTEAGPAKPAHQTKESAQWPTRRKSSALEEAWARNDLGALDELIASNIVNHDAPPGLPPGLEGAKAEHSMFMASFPDRQQTIEQIVGEGDLVAVRTTSTATHTGAPFLGVPTSGNKVWVESMSLCRVAGGKTAEHWGISDGLGLMRQLGAISAPTN